MAYNYEYPYTDPYRHNDDWLINRVKALDKKVTDLDEHIEEIVAELFKPLEESLTEFLQDQIRELRAEMTEADEEIVNKIDNLSNAIYTELSGIKDDIRALLTKHDRDIEEVYRTIGDRFDILNDLINEFNTDSIGRDDALRIYIDSEIERLKLEISKSVPVINPVFYKPDNLQNALYDIVDYLKYGALTGLEYEMRHWSADEYDTLNMTAKKYDFTAKNRTRYLNPFSGLFESAYKWFMDLTELHRNAYTAGELDAKLLSCTGYEAIGFSAFNFDFKNKEIM